MSCYDINKLDISHDDISSYNTTKEGMMMDDKEV